MRQFNGRLDQVLRYTTFLNLSICRSCSHCLSYIVWVELWYPNQRTGLQFSGAPEPPRVIQNICPMSISGPPDPRIGKEFRIFTEPTMLNNLQSIAPENRYEHLDSPESDPALYVTNYPGLKILSKRYGVDVLYSKTWLTYSRLTGWMQRSISLLTNAVLVNLRFTLLLSLMVSVLTLHAYTIERLISTSKHLLFTYDPTPGISLNGIYPHRITFERFMLLNALNLRLQEHKVLSVTRQTIRCRRGSSHSVPATIWIYASLECQVHRLNAITVMLRVNPFSRGRCPRHSYHRCPALGDTKPHLTGHWLGRMFRLYISNILE